MKIRVNNDFGNPIVVGVAEYAASALYGSDFEYGRTETTEKGVENAHKAIGRLLDVLSGKGLLTAGEVVLIADNREHSEAVFE